MRKVAIVGAGAIGSTMGALLDCAREQVYLIGRQEHVRAIKKNKGLLLDGIKGDIKARIQATEVLDFKPDLVLLAVKTQDVTSALEKIKPYIEGVPVLTMQNGIRSDELAAAVIGKEYLMSAVVRMTSTFLEPGKVTYLESGGLVIGAPYPECKVPIEKFLNLLIKVTPTTVTENIHGIHWAKLIGNLNNALSAVTGTEMKTIAYDGTLARISVQLMKEGIRVANAQGAKLEPLPGVPAGLFKVLPILPEWLAGKMVGRTFRRMLRNASDAPFYGSTLQSLKRGKPTEIDYLNGEIVRIGQTVHVPTPLNEKMVNMVHEIERTGRFLSQNDMVSRLKNGFR